MIRIITVHISRIYPAGLWNEVRSTFGVSLMKQLVCVLSMVALAAAGAIAQQPAPTVPTPPAAPAPDPDLKPFLDAVDEYLALHHKLHEEIPKLQPSSLPKEITQASD